MILQDALLRGSGLLIGEAHPLAHLNAFLNATATFLLILGYLLIKGRREIAHRNIMLSAFGTSVLFLISYLAYHMGVLGAQTTKFVGPESIRNFVYFPILFSHIVLAALVPFLAIITIYLGFREKRTKHRKLARWTFPIWLYVSVTGVIVYFMLYQIYPAP